MSEPDFDITKMFDSENESLSQSDVTDVVNVTRDEEVTFDDMIASATHSETRTYQKNAPRYGVSLLMDMDLLDSSPYNFKGDFNKKKLDGRGVRVNEVNVAAFPRLELMPFRSTEITIPFEGTAVALTDEEIEHQSAPFDPTTMEATSASARRKMPISALQIATQVLETHRNDGFVILDDLTGIEDYNDAKRLFKAVLDVFQVLTKFPNKPRERKGFVVEPPFITDLIAYLETYSRENYLQHVSNTDYAKCEKIRQQLLTACRLAHRECEKTLANTERDIESGNKKTYDLPNYTHLYAKPPRDLVCMAHLDKYPMSEKSFEIARTAGEAFAQNHQRQAVQPVSDGDLLSREDVDRMLQEQEERLMQKFAEMQQKPAGNSSAQPPRNAANNAARQQPQGRK